MEQHNNNIQDIQSLQKTEKDLLDSLETDLHLTPDQHRKLIDKINALADMRVNLYKSIGQNTALYQNNLDQAQDTIIQQTAAIDIEERSLNETKRRLRAIHDRNLQDLRIIENNRYFSDKYRDHAQAAFAIMIYFIGLIIINFLYKSGIMPNAVYWALIIALTIYVAYNFWNSLFLMYKRNNMNYSQFDFVPPNPATIPASAVSDSGTGAANANDPWWKPTPTCVGGACCTSGMVFDSEKNMCVVSASSSSGLGTTAAATSA